MSTPKVREQTVEAARDVLTDAESGKEIAEELRSIRNQLDECLNQLHASSLAMQGVASRLQGVVEKNVQTEASAHEHFDTTSNLLAATHRVTEGTDNQNAVSARTNQTLADTAAGQSRGAHLRAGGVLENTRAWPREIHQAIGDIAARLTSLDERLGSLQSITSDGVSASERSAAASTADAEDLERYERDVS